VALGIGLLIGAERERRKGEGPDRAAAGIRTFAIAALVGAVAMLLGGGVILATAVLCVGALTLLAYQRARHVNPGLTTEMALVLTTLLGGFAIEDATLAAAVGAALALLLAGRNRLHHFVKGVLTEQELHDALLFAAAVLILLPLAPDRYLGPFNAINPYSLVLLVVLVMGINAAGYIATRFFGPRYGLPIAGLAGGFVSSTATIHAMGTRIREMGGLGIGNAGDKTKGDEATASEVASAGSASMRLVRSATAGAVLSSVATLIQMILVLSMLQRELAMALMLPMALGILVSVIYAGFFVRGALLDHKGPRLSTLPLQLKPRPVPKPTLPPTLPTPPTLLAPLAPPKPTQNHLRHTLQMRHPLHLNQVVRLIPSRRRALRLSWRRCLCLLAC